MTTVTAGGAMVKIREYLRNDIATPFFVIVDDAIEYQQIVNDLGTLRQIHVSDYCASPDVFPNIDILSDTISAVTQNTLLLGIGEYVALSGNANVLDRFKDICVSAKVILIGRGIRANTNDLCAEDRKFNSRRACFLKAGDTFEIIRFQPDLTACAIIGFKALLCHLETGACNTLLVKSSLPLQNCRQVSSAYEAVRHMNPAINLPQRCLADEFWTEYLANPKLEGFERSHWRSYLKYSIESPKDVYLKLVIENATSYEVYRKRVYSALLDIPTNNKLFQEMYSARKALFHDVTDSEIAEYVAGTKSKGKERIYYLTDNTVCERCAIIESLNGLSAIPLILKDIYPALYEYLFDYPFSTDIGQQLSVYFTEYKQQKLTNRLTPEFHGQVLSLATDGNRLYNCLPTRGAVLDSIDKENSALYWIDAMGVEYLGYIQSRANVFGLKINVHIVRANLPTITSFNSDFYEAWNGVKAQTKALDKIKHEGEQDFNYQVVKTPIYLAEELRIIDDVFEWVKVKLASKTVEKVILVSDHGASRLAVINEHECKWEMIEKGEHSGRCCPCSDVDVKSEYATEERGFWVLANYDRFKGGRKANVEVHGGASLEEVVVPLIEITLFDNAISIINTTPVTLTSHRKNAEIILYCGSVLKSMSVRVQSQRYFAEAIGDNRYKVVFSDIKRSGKYVADVFEGDNLVGQCEFEVQHEMGKTNDSDWF